MKMRLKKHPRETLQDFVKWYNEKGIHHALGYKTPEVSTNYRIIHFKKPIVKEIGGKMLILCLKTSTGI